MLNVPARVISAAAAGRSCTRREHICLTPHSKAKQPHLLLLLLAPGNSCLPLITAVCVAEAALLLLLSQQLTQPT